VHVDRERAGLHEPLRERGFERAAGARRLRRCERKGQRQRQAQGGRETAPGPCRRET